jgi:hypothetical protein
MDEQIKILDEELSHKRETEEDVQVSHCIPCSLQDI